MLNNMDELIESVAMAMYMEPDPADPVEGVSPWPPENPEDHAWWISRAGAALAAIYGLSQEFIAESSSEEFNQAIEDVKRMKPDE